MAKTVSMGALVDDQLRPSSAHTPPLALKSAAGTEGVFRLSMAHFLLALILLIVTAPFVIERRYGTHIESVLLSLVLLTGVLAVGGRRRTLLVGGALAVPAVVGHWAWHLYPELFPRELALVAGIAFVAFIIVHLLYFILSAPQVNSEVLYAAVATYLIMGILWSFAYILVARLVPSSFHFNVGGNGNQLLDGFEALYFSFITLATVGYGDIVPVANVARLLAMMESTTGMFYVTVLIARLVSLYAVEPRN